MRVASRALSRPVVLLMALTFKSEEKCTVMFKSMWSERFFFEKLMFYSARIHSFK